MNVLLVGLGAVVGAPLRYLIDRAVQARHRSRFPAGTLLVNLIACALLGLVTGAVAGGAFSAHLQLLLGTGLCGALSTYSTFSFETVRLTEDGAARLAVLNLAVSIGVGLLAAVAGVAIGRSF